MPKDKLNIKSKNQLQIAKDFFNAIIKGKPMPLIHFKNVNVLFKQLDADKTLSELDKKRILSFIIKHNEKQLQERKIQLEVLKIENKQNKQVKSHNWDGGFKHKHSFSEFAHLRKQVNDALVSKNNAQNAYDTGRADQQKAIDFYNSCSKWCKMRGNAHYSVMAWWESTGMPRRSKALATAKDNYTKLSAKLRTWEKEDENFVLKQKQDAEEARKRAERLAEQEKHEAELKAEAEKLRKLKIEAAKQAAEIARVEEEEKKAKAEKEKAKAETSKLKTSKNFGANITNNITNPENKKTIYIIIGSTLLLAIIGGSITIFKNK